MSLTFKFTNDKFSLEKLNLPSRYYYFDDSENYMKLLNIGEGIFPKDRIKLHFILENSNLILTSESATKIYPSQKEFALNNINIELKNSNLEFINDELILFKDSRYIQLFRLSFDENSTFFYVDILSRGRSFENFDFTNILVKNSFYENKKLNYLEKFDLSGFELKDYINRRDTTNFIFAKIYIKTLNNEEFLNNLQQRDFESFTYSKDKKIILGVISSDNMGDLKSKIMNVWKIYRNSMDKKEFILGKQ